MFPVAAVEARSKKTCICEALCCRCDGPFKVLNEVVGLCEGRGRIKIYFASKNVG